MGLFVWNDSYSVGVAQLDTQHKKLISMLNDLQQAMQKGEGKNVMAGIIEQLINYSVTHFEHEEKYMVSTKYPDYAAHKAIHNDFASKVLEFQKKFKDGSLTLSVSVMNFLTDWLRDHIKGIDRKYTAHFNSNGLK